MSNWHFIAPPNEPVEKSLGIVRCGVCGRPLTAPKSVAAGIGPVCKSHGAAKSSRRKGRKRKRKGK